MIRGVEFEIPQETADTLWRILNCIDIEIFEWHLIDSQEEVWDEKHNEPFFEVHSFSGKDFAKKIQSNHYIVFLKLTGYFTDGAFGEFQTYDEFINSDCQILLLIYDCEYVEIYCKDESISETIYNHAVSQKYGKVRHIFNDRNPRTTMNIL